MTQSTESPSMNPSRLHECAVGLIWETLVHGETDHGGYAGWRTPKPREVWIVDDDGQRHELINGFGSATIPTVLQPIQGTVPTWRSWTPRDAWER